MAGDLERFLQQAAERLKQKVEQGAPRPAPRPKKPPPVRQAERARPRLSPDVVDSEILEAELIPSAKIPRELGPDRLSNIDTRPTLAQGISLADEKMEGHLHDVFDHDVSQLQKASSALGGSSEGQEHGSQVRRRQHEVSPLLQMLRGPESLRAAFLASEVFRRKFE